MGAAAAPGRALTALGGTVAETGFTLIDREHDLIAKQRETDFQNGVRALLYDPTEGYMHQQGQAAVSGYQGLQERLRGLAKQSAENLPPAVARRLEASLAGRVDAALTRAGNHMAASHRTWETQASDARIEMSFENALLDLDGVEDAFADISREIRTKAAVNGWAAERTALEISKAQSQLYQNRLMQVANADPQAALMYLQQNADKFLPSAYVDLHARMKPMALEAEGRALGAAALFSGVSDEYLRNIRQAESGGNDAAQAATSSATGRYQFTTGTWAMLAKKYPELALTPDGRFDANQQERAIRAFTRDNAAALQGSGIAPTMGNLYASHFLGSGDAVKVLKAADSTSLETLLSAKVINANSFLKGWTVGKFRQWAARKGGGTQLAFSERPAGIESLLNIEDSTVRAAALREFELRQGVQVSQARSARDANAQSAYAHIEQGGAYDDLPLEVRLALGREEAAGLQRYETQRATGVPIETDFAFYTDLYDTVGANPQSFIDTNPMSYRDKLSDADFRAAVKLRKDMMEGERGEPIALSRVTGQAKAAIEAAGLALNENKPLQGRLVQHLFAFSSQNPDASDADLYLEANRQMATVTSRGIAGIGRIDGPAVSIDIDGETLTTDDDVSGVLFVERLMQGDVKVNGVEVGPGFAASVFDLLVIQNNRDPSPKELMDTIIERMIQ